MQSFEFFPEAIAFKGFLYYNDNMTDSYYISEQSAAEGNFTASVGMTAFGQTENHDAFFTGKPHVDNLGYAFFFRNYRPTLGKWQTADPLGYPDGRNNFAYCNNRTTMYVDFRGGNVRHYLDTEGGIGGSGHSAWIVGTAQTGYTVYDYGPQSSSGSGHTNLTGKFSTLKEAENFLQASRSGINKYDKVQEFATTDDQDEIFVVEANKYMKIEYDYQEHNCYQLGYDSMTAGEVSLPKRGVAPKAQFIANLNYGSARNVKLEE